jgi:DNA-binding LacI/PurR family transcriptional regulator
MAAVPAPPESVRRPTLRVIAQQAGVTHATVSMALRNHPLISTATRRKVQRVAAKLGYTPDPQVAKLMQHLRLKHKPKFQSTLAAVTTLAEGDELAYARAVRDGAQSAAETFGYGFSVFRVAADVGRDTSLQRILRSRGVEGLLLLPMHAPREFGRFLDWSQFSIVAATHGVLAPEVHRVVPDQFGNTQLICEHLAGLGCRRIGLVISAETDLTVGHRFSAPVVWQNTKGGGEYVEPFTYTGDYLRGLREWYEAQRPDGLIVGDEVMARAIVRELRLRQPGPVKVALTERLTVSPYSGIEQRAREVGAAAVAQLHALVQRGEKGIPRVPSVTMIKGHWESSPARRAAARRNGVE